MNALQSAMVKDPYGTVAAKCVIIRFSTQHFYTRTQLHVLQVLAPTKRLVSDLRERGRGDELRDRAAAKTVLPNCLQPAPALEGDLLDTAFPEGARADGFDARRDKQFCDRAVFEAAF